MRTAASLELVRAIGSPFAPSIRQWSDGDLLTAFPRAFRDRVALLLLDRFRRPDWCVDLEEHYQRLEARRRATMEVIGRAARILNDVVPAHYVVFKSLKPYPATPNDTDVLILPRGDYERAFAAFLAAGYGYHEWAPTQRTLVDPLGLEFVGPGKKGGTYYIDLYEDISTDYFAYLNPNSIESQILDAVVAGVPVRVLRAEPELAIILLHSVFPERTFQLEHFFLPLHYLKHDAFDGRRFLSFVDANHLRGPVRTALSLVEQLHEEAFGTSPAPLGALLDAIGRSRRARVRFAGEAFSTPHMFSVYDFFATFAGRLRDPYCLRSLGTQARRMLHPRFFVDVMTSLRKRLSERGTYHQE